MGTCCAIDEVTYDHGVLLPELGAEWRGLEAGVARRLLDLRTYDFTLRVVQKFVAHPVALFTKTAGLTGFGPDASPNLLVEWAHGEIDVLAAGEYAARIDAIRQSDSAHRALRFDLTIRPDIV